MYLQGQRIDSNIIKKVSIQNKLPEQWVEKIHNFQFDIVKKGLKKFKSIEVTDFFVLKISPKALDRKIGILTERLENCQEIVSSTEDLELQEIYKQEESNLFKELEYIKTKL